MASWGQRNVTPDPRPPRRLKAVPAEWAVIGEHFADACCVACGEGRDVSLHHITPKSQGGDDVIQNLAPLCGDGTRGCHGKLEGHAPGWERVAAAVRVYVLTNRDRCTYAVSKVGWERFSKRYPLLDLDEVEGHGVT